MKKTFLRILLPTITAIILFSGAAIPDARAANPAVAWTGSSYGVVEVRKQEHGSSIVFKRLDTSGNTIQKETEAATAGTPIAFPTIHWTGQTFLLFWTEVSGNGTFISARRLDGAGMPASPAVRIHRSDAPIVSFTSIAVEQNPHHFALSWEERIAPENTRSLFLRVDTAGAKLMEPIVVSESKPQLPAPPKTEPRPGPTIERIQQLQRTPSAGGPIYPSQPSGTAQSVTSKTGPFIYSYLPLKTIPLPTPSPFRPATTEAATTTYYPFSPTPTFGQTIITPTTQAQAQTPSPTPTVPETTSVPAAESQPLLAGDLARASLPSVYQFGADGKRHLFPDDFTFKSWSNKYEWVITISDERLQAIPEGRPILIYPGYAIVAFTGDPSLYTVSRVGVLKQMRSTAEARERYGANWKKRIHVYPKELQARYTIEKEKGKAKNKETKKLLPRRNEVKAGQPKNLRARKVL